MSAVQTSTLNFYKKLKFTNTPEDFPIFREELRKNSVLHCYGLPEGTDYKAFYTKLTDQAGDIVAVDEQHDSGDRTYERWTDVRYDKDKADKFRHSNTRQPLHTDAAYTTYYFDIALFFCLENAEIGGATTFIDAEDILNILKKYEHLLLNELTSTTVTFTKGEGEVKKSKIVSYDEKGPILNWNYFRVSEENNEPKTMDIVNRFHRFLEDHIVGGGLTFPVKLKVGESVFFHDSRILHGRKAFYGSRNLIKGGMNLSP